MRTLHKGWRGIALFVQNDRTLTSRSSSTAIPTFALYGEAGAPRPELLHVEEIQSRSRLYHWEIAPHLHQGLFQVLWVLRGAAQVALDERRERVEGPAAIVIPPGIVHGFRFAQGTDGLVLTLSARFLGEGGDFQAVGESFSELFSAPGVLRFDTGAAEAQRMDALLRQVEAEFNAPGGAQSPVASWLARAVVWKLAQAAANRRDGGDPRRYRHQALFARFLMLVEQNFLAHWTVEQYASRLGMTAARLNRLTRAEAGQPALELVHERLTREACRRLAYIEAPAATLASELGFEDPAYFSRFFKRRTGQTPQRWRQAQRAA